MAWATPTPIVPNVPASSLERGTMFGSTVRPMSIVLAPSLAMMASSGIASRTARSTR